MMTQLGLDISFQDVADVLGITTGDAEDLFASPDINPWSPCKPFASSRKGYDSFTEYRAALALANYGFSIPEPVRRDARTAALSAYIYARPTANFRLGDFRRYNHAALPVISSIPDMTVRADFSSCSFSFTFRQPGDYDLGISDFEPIQDYYLAVILSRDNWTTTYVVTSQTTIGDGATDVALGRHSPFDAAGTWQYMLAACSLPSPSPGTAQTTSSSPFGAAYYLPLPFGHPAQNIGTLTVTPVQAVLYVDFRLQRTTDDVWTLTPSVTLSAPHTAAVDCSVTGIRVTRAGGYIDYRISAAAAASQAYTIPAGSTVPSSGITPMTQASFRAPLPSLESGDMLQLKVTISPSSLTRYIAEREVF